MHNLKELLKAIRNFKKGSMTRYIELYFEAKLERLFKMEDLRRQSPAAETECEWKAGVQEPIYIPMVRRMEPYQNQTWSDRNGLRFQRLMKPIQLGFRSETYSILLSTTTRCCPGCKNYSIFGHQFRREASQQIGHINMSNANYYAVWDLLMKRYDNKRTIGQYTSAQTIELILLAESAKKLLKVGKIKLGWVSLSICRIREQARITNISNVWNLHTFPNIVKMFKIM